MNWNELTITASTRCGNETTPISNLNVCFVLYDPSIETYYYFDRQTNSSGVAVLEGSSTLLTSSDLGVRTQTLSERECGSCFGSEKENSRYSTTTIQGSGFVASSNPSYWFVESEFEGNGFSSEMYNLSQTSGELIYETDANGERAIMASTTIKISVTNSTIPSIMYSYWIYDSNLTTIKKDVVSSGSTLVIDNIPQDASKYIIHAFAEDGRFREYIDATKIQITAGTENTKSITLASTGGDGYKFFINRLTCSDTLFNYIGADYLVYPVQMYIENSNNGIVYSNLIEGSSSSSDISGYCGTRYIRFAVSGATSPVYNNYSSSITEYDLFGYIGGNINVDLLIPRKNYEIELPPVYDTVEFNPNIEARPSYSLPNTTIDTGFRAWDGSELCYDYNFQTASTYLSTSITITNSSISSNTLNKNWFYRCLAGKNISYNSVVNLDLSKNHYYDAHYTFVVSSYPVTNLSYTSNTKDYLYMCKSTLGNNGALVPNYEPLFAFTINRENDVVFTRNEINDYVKGFAYVYTGNRGSKDIALINQIYGTDYTEESERERDITSRPNYASFTISPTGKTPPSSQDFMATCSNRLVEQSVSSLEDFKSRFINNLTTTGNSGSQIVTKYAIKTEDEYDYEQEYLYNSYHCYVMDRTIIPELNELDSNDGYFYFHNNNKKSGINPHENICTSVQISLEKHGNPNAINLQYSKDKINWTSYTIDAKLLLARNETIYFRNGTNSNGLSQSTANYYTFVVDNDYKPDNTSQTTYNDYFTENNIISGNLDYNTYGYDIRVGGKISSLLGLLPNSGKTVQNYCFYNLFKGCKITSCKGINNDNLPSLHLDLDTISDYGYRNMFDNTPFLIIGPYIMAKTVGSYSMYKMFFQSNVNELVVNTLDFQVASLGCCKEMFRESNFCHHFTINSTTTSKECFNSMFALTKNLRYNKIRLKDIQNFATSSCTKMFYGSVLYTFPQFYNEITTIGDAAFSEAFLGTNLNNIDFVLAQTGSVGVEGCKYMFRGLSPQIACSLNGLKLSANTKYESCYYGMFQNAKRLAGTFWLPTYSISTSGCAYMFNGAEGVYCYSLWPTQLSNACYTHMFDHCNFRDIGGTNVGWHAYPGPKLPATSLTEDCYSYMFMGSNIDRHHDMYVPKAETLYQPTKYVLNATTLPKRCYYAMYQDSQLKYVSSIITSGLTAAGESSCGHMFQNTPIFIDNRARKIVRNDGVDVTLRYHYDGDDSRYIDSEGDNATCVGEDAYLSNYSKFNVLSSFTVTLGNDKTLVTGTTTLIYSGGTKSATTTNQYVMQRSSNDYDYEFVDKYCDLLKSQITINSDVYKYKVIINGIEYKADGQSVGEYMNDVHKIYYIYRIGQKRLISVNDTCYLMVRLNDIINMNINMGGGLNLRNYSNLDYRPFVWIPVSNGKVFSKEKRGFKTSAYASCSFEENQYPLPSWTKIYFFTEPGMDGIYSVNQNYTLHYEIGPELVNLNATSLDNYCYEYMFSGCTNLYFGHNFKFGNLVNLSKGCFSHMFDTCQNLRTITPDIRNFSSMGEYSCEYMYARCCYDGFDFKYIENTASSWWDAYGSYVEIAIIILAAAVIGGFIIGGSVAAGGSTSSFLPAATSHASVGACKTFESASAIALWWAGLSTFVKGLLVLSAVCVIGLGIACITTEEVSETVSDIYNDISIWVTRQYDTLCEHFSQVNNLLNGQTHDELLGDAYIGLNHITNPDDIYTSYNKYQSIDRKTLDNFRYVENGIGYIVTCDTITQKETPLCQYENGFRYYSRDKFLWRVYGLNIAPFNTQKQYQFNSTTNIGCYLGMFEDNFALNFAKINLSGTTNVIPNFCYKKMFYGCTNLKLGPIIPEMYDTVGEESMHSMFKGCFNYFGDINFTNTLTPMNLGKNCYKEMYYMCHSISGAPYLPATTMVTGCYNSMFRYARAHFTTSAYKCYTDNDDKLYFILYGDIGCVQMKMLHLSNAEIFVGSSNFSWILVDNLSKKVESDKFKNLEIKDNNDTLIIKARNKKFRAPDSVYFLTANTETILNQFTQAFAKILRECVIYDTRYKEYHDWRNKDVNIEATDELHDFKNIVDAQTETSDFNGAAYCEQISYIKANISKTDLESGNYTENWVESLKNKGVLGEDTSSIKTGEYHGRASNANYGPSFIPTGWTRHNT